MKDETVNPQSTINWLKRNHIFDKVTLIENPTNAHQISLSVFKENIENVLSIVPHEV
jgi:hypothetical protein